MVLAQFTPPEVTKMLPSTMNRFFTYTFAGKGVARPNKYMERIVLLIREYVPNITEQEMQTVGGGRQ